MFELIRNEIDDVQNLLPAPKKPEPNLSRLKDILSLRRGHGSDGERKMCEQQIASLPGALKPKIFMDSAGKEIAAYVVEVLLNDEPVHVLWSCHVDTVHSTHKQGTKQVVHFDTDTKLAFKSDKEPLGADDGAGVWLLLEMIDAKVPGYYIFHRGEERGGIGSGEVAKTQQEFLKKFTHAIAFDRRGSKSIITQQSRGVCCSNKFAEHFGSLINDEEYQLKPDPTGTFTDTAKYLHLIPECTNVSVGYENEHSGDELLDLEYLMWLRAKMLSIDVLKLISVVDREAKDPPVYTFPGRSFAGNMGGWYGQSLQDELLDDGWNVNGKAGKGISNINTHGEFPAKKKAKPNKITTNTAASFVGGQRVKHPRTSEDILDMRTVDIKQWVATSHPWEVAELIVHLALKAEGFITRK